MEATIRAQIERECQKLIARHNLRIKLNKKNQERFRKRTGSTPVPPQTYEPDYWQLDPLFNPFHVRKRAASIAHAIATKIRARTYQPRPALGLRIPKPSGGSRGITIFTIPDAAVSNYLFHVLRGRNQQFFSSYAYAYRGDRSVHHAIEHLFRYLKETERVYALNYDFSKYFDSISHDYLRDILRRSFRVSEKERSAVESFLTYQLADGPAAYQAQQFTENTRGVPQGSSISLFLANVACLELDLEIEREGAVFARYADDTVILCNSYETAHRCANRMLAHGRRSRTEINFEKSDGISLLSREPSAEIRSIQFFDFLGNRISQQHVAVADRSIHRIKKKISAIIHRHLILYPNRNQFSRDRIGRDGLDWDLVTCINEIRRYLYGRITENEIRSCLENAALPLVMTKSLLSYYPLVTNPAVFVQLDGWLVNVIKRAQKRRQLLVRRRVRGYQTYSDEQLLSGSWYQSEVPNDVRLPSFHRAWRYVRKLLNVFGASRFPVPDYES